MTHFPKHMDATEAKIANRLLTAILRHPDLLVRVFDGEEWSTDWTRDRAAIQRETAATDMTRYSITRLADNGAARRLGSILLIHGNGEDVISDYSWNTKVDAVEALLDEVCDYANQGA